MQAVEVTAFSRFLASGAVVPLWPCAVATGSLIPMCANESTRQHKLVGARGTAGVHCCLLLLLLYHSHLPWYTLLGNVSAAFGYVARWLMPYPSVQDQLCCSIVD